VVSVLTGMPFCPGKSRIRCQQACGRSGTLVKAKPRRALAEAADRSEHDRVPIIHVPTTEPIGPAGGRGDMVTLLPWKVGCGLSPWLLTKWHQGDKP
jgi:hypothetical protein